MRFLRCAPILIKSMALLCVWLCGTNDTFADEPIKITREFNVITSKNATGYFKPLFTTIGEGFNTNTYTVARYPSQWRLGLDLSACAMLIPSSQTTYDALLPEDYGNTNITQTAELRGSAETRNASGTSVQPTIYGGVATPIFSAPQSGGPPGVLRQPATVTYMEGNNATFMASIPAVQIIFGIPTRTQLHLRFLSIPIKDASTTYFGIMASQQFNHLFGLFADDSLIGIALNAGYHSFSVGSSVSVNSLAFGIHGSKTWLSGLSLYGGIQYENLSGNISFVREKDLNIISKSPFAEIRNQEDLKMDVTTYADMRIAAGVSYKIGILELHADAAYAAQPTLAAGLTLWFMNIGNDESYDINKNRR